MEHEVLTIVNKAEEIEPDQTQKAPNQMKRTIQ